MAPAPVTAAAALAALGIAYAAVSAVRRTIRNWGGRRLGGDEPPDERAKPADMAAISAAQRAEAARARQLRNRKTGRTATPADSRGSERGTPSPGPSASGAAHAAPRPSPQRAARDDAHASSSPEPPPVAGPSHGASIFSARALALLAPPSPWASEGGSPPESFPLRALAVETLAEARVALRELMRAFGGLGDGSDCPARLLEAPWSVRELAEDALLKLSFLDDDREGGPGLGLGPGPSPGSLVGCFRHRRTAGMGLAAHEALGISLRRGLSLPDTLRVLAHELTHWFVADQRRLGLSGLSREEEEGVCELVGLAALLRLAPRLPAHDAPEADAARAYAAEAAAGAASRGADLYFDGLGRAVRTWRRLGCTLGELLQFLAAGNPLDP
eukprot:tig00000093_g3630.t1